MTWSVDRKYSLAFGAALVMMGGIAALSYGSLLGIKAANRSVNHTQTVMATTNTILSSLKDAETGQRGYLLTGKLGYLEPYNTAVLSLNPTIDQLAQLTADNPVQQKNIQRLRQLTRQKLTELQETIKLRQTQGIPAALAVVTTDEGKQVMDQIRVLHNVMEQEELRLLEIRSRLQQSNADWATIFTLGGTLLEAIAFSFIFLALNRAAQNLKHSQTALRRLNIELEARVEARTTELSQLNQQLTQEIVERQQVELNLKNRVVEVSELYNNAPCGYQSLDAQGIYVQINDTALDWLGYSREEMIQQKNFTEVITPVGIATFTHNFGQLKAGKADKGSAEFEIVRKDGSILPVSVSSMAVRDRAGQFMMTRCTLTDISDRKRIENTLREAERRWRSVLENVRLVVIGLDINGRVEFANSFFLELTEYTQAEVLGQDWFKTFVPLYQQPGLETAFQELLEQDFHPYYRNLIITKSGQERLIAWNNTLLRDTKGKVIGTLSIGEDVTQRQAVEHLKNEFISIVSHELRTPLTSIRGSLGLLATGALNDHPTQMQRMIEIAAIDTERLVRLVNDILDLEHLESGKIILSKEICDVSTLLQRSLEVMQPSADEAQVALVVDATSAQLWVDSDRIIQILTNLLSNAIKFSPPGSTINLRVQPLTHPSEASVLQCLLNPQSARIDDFTSLIGAMPEPTQILFQVSDQGRGIPSDKLDTIFGRFQQVDASDSRSKGGTGLGLAICQSIVQQHGGHIWVESMIGEGSTFCFTLPADIPAQKPSSRLGKIS